MLHARAMNDVAIIKRISEIGAELVLLGRQRDEIDNRTKMLLREAHRLTRPKGTDYDGEPIPPLPPAIVNGGARLRNGEPTNRSRVLGYLGGMTRAVTKYEVAQALGLNPQQAHYCLVGLQRHGLTAPPVRSQWVLTDRGKEARGKLPAQSFEPTITVEASQDRPSDTP
jgi:hypothetical protein